MDTGVGRGGRGSGAGNRNGCGCGKKLLDVVPHSVAAGVFCGFVGALGESLEAVRSCARGPLCGRCSAVVGFAQRFGRLCAFGRAGNFLIMWNYLWVYLEYFYYLLTKYNILALCGLVSRAFRSFRVFSNFGYLCSA